MADWEEEDYVEKEVGDQETNTDREHDRILKEIETTDTAFIGASLRAVYEGNDHEKFLETLDSRIKQHDRDIERLCNFHYQGFIESITELIKVRSDAETLKKQVVTINKDLQESGKEVARKCEDIIQCRLQQRNIASAIEGLTMCLPVLQTYSKMQDQMKAGRYYSALKTLEQLEHTYLPPVHKYRFCEIMIDNIPKIREQIKEVSMSELKDFLEVVRKKSPNIGMLAMSQVDKERNLENMTEADGNTASYQFLIVQESPTEADRHHMTTNGLSKPEPKKRKPKNTNKSRAEDAKMRTNPFDETLDDLDSSNPFAESNGISLNPFEEEEYMGDGANPFEADTPEDFITDTDNVEGVTQENFKETVGLPKDGNSPVVAPPRRKKKKKLLLADSSMEDGNRKENTAPPGKKQEDPDSSSHPVLGELAEVDQNQRAAPPEIIKAGGQAESLVHSLKIPKSPWKEKPKDRMPLVLQDVSPSDLVDFSPVYKCLHIFGILKARDQFEKYYRSQRQNQARIALQPPTNMHESLAGYALFFHQIVGFFVVEDHVLHTAQNLIDRLYIDGLWDMALSEIIAVLRSDSGYCADADVLMSLKNLIVVFADTLKAYGFVVDHLFSLLIEMRDQYSEILLKKWAGVLQTIFDEDNYTPIEVNSDTEAIKLLSSFPYEDPNFEKASFPKQLPFSRFVPRVFNEIKRFISACLDYCEDLHLSSTEVDDMIRKSTNLLLTRTLSSELQKLVQKPTLGLTELVQITINTSFLENSCKHVEVFVHSITGVDSSASHTAKLVGVSTFKDARSETEAQIYHKVNSKVDEFFELAEYDWEMMEPQGTASSYLLDLIAFLKHNFKVFTHLPEKVAQTSCMSACKHIAARLMETLLDDNIRQISMAALQQYNLDVMQCELFSNSEPVPGFQDGALQMSFLELRQLLDLFLSWDWSSYLADYGSGNSKYLRVNPATALALLEKIREDSKRRNIFTSFSRQEREKKKLLETVLKQLRNIVNVPSAPTTVSEPATSQGPNNFWNFVENKFKTNK